jgi:steroid Delta-isomerase
VAERVPPRIAQHVTAFNAAVESGDWTSFADRFADDAHMEFVGVPAGPFDGRASIAAAYRVNPPDDTMTVRSVEPGDTSDVVRFAWTAGGTGTMTLEWAPDGLVRELVVAFD